MKKIVMLAMLVLTNTAFAVENVKCMLFYSQVDDQGYLVDTTYLTTKTLRRSAPTVVSLRGFELTLSAAERVCASDGGPCSDVYRLTAEIVKDKSSSYNHLKESELLKMQLNLKVGKERVEASCSAD